MSIASSQQVAVCRFRDILIRFRIRGSVPLVYGSWSVRILLLSSESFKMPTKINIFPKVFLAYYLPSVCIFTSVKKSKFFFFLIFCLLVKGSGSGFVQITTYPHPGWPKAYGSNWSGSGSLAGRLLRWSGTAVEFEMYAKKLEHWIQLEGVL